MYILMCYDVAANLQRYTLLVITKPFLGQVVFRLLAMNMFCIMPLDWSY